MCVCFCLGTCVHAYLKVCEHFECVCESRKVGVRGKTCPFDSLTTQCVQQKYWVLVAGLHFRPLRFSKYSFLGIGSRMGVTHVCFFFSWGNRSDWCYFSGNGINENVTYQCVFFRGWTSFKNSKHSVWRLDKTQSANETAEEKCWGQILAHCTLKKYIPLCP